MHLILIIVYLFWDLKKKITAKYKLDIPLDQLPQLMDFFIKKSIDIPFPH